MKKIMIGSILVVFMLMLLPSSIAVQSNAGLNGIAKLPDIEKIQNMDIDELIDVIVEISKEYPLIHEEIVCQIEEMEDEKILQDELNEPADSNQSIIEKIWLGVFNYRLFRLYISLFVYLYVQSKLTMIRTTTWAMKVLRWVKIGIILGVVDPTIHGPSETPDISFEMDMENNTLTVISVSPEDVLWTDINQIGSGSCDPLPTGNVTVGDEITNCAGIIVLRYVPTDDVLGIFDFG